MQLKAKIEELIYKKAGGGESGKKAVMARREYLKENYEYIRIQQKEIAQFKYLPRRESEDE